MSSASGLIKDRMVGWTILLVEDDEDAIRITSRWFRLAGATLLSAGDGATALEIARSHDPTLIISDLHMPVMDGWHLCKALKSDHATKDIPIIALSADYTSEAKQHSREAGFAGYIRKPLDPTKFLDILVEIIQSIPELAAKWELTNGNE
jgi:CheY-like chemotaxis protein